MDIEQLTAAGKRLFGHKHWKLKLAQALGVNPATIYRICKRNVVPGPYEVAIKGLLQHKRAQDILDKQARKLLPRKFKYKRKTDGQGRPVKRLVKRLVKRRARKEKGHGISDERRDEAGDQAAVGSEPAAEDGSGAGVFPGGPDRQGDGGQAEPAARGDKAAVVAPPETGDLRPEGDNENHREKTD